MDFPGKPKKYSDNVNQSYELEQPLSYIAVPGAQGEKGQKGDNGEQGPQGIQGYMGYTGSSYTSASIYIISAVMSAVLGM